MSETLACSLCSVHVSLDIIFESTCLCVVSLLLFYIRIVSDENEIVLFFVVRRAFDFFSASLSNWRVEMKNSTYDWKFIVSLFRVLIFILFFDNHRFT